jgi:hypothetical protein
LESGVDAVGLAFAVVVGTWGSAAALLEWALMLGLAQASAVELRRESLVALEGRYPVPGLTGLLIPG